MNEEQINQKTEQLTEEIHDNLLADLNIKINNLINDYERYSKESYNFYKIGLLSGDSEASYAGVYARYKACKNIVSDLKDLQR
jgi:hypothetical protein